MTGIATVARPNEAGPLRRVVAGLQAGARDRASLTRLTGLDRDVVDTAVDHLVRLGRVSLAPFGGGCPTQGCGACPSGRPAGAAGCGAWSLADSRAPVAVTLVPRQPE